MIQIKNKPNVNLQGVKPEILAAEPIFLSVLDYEFIGLKHPVVLKRTSCVRNKGQYETLSLHHIGQAIDYVLSCDYIDISTGLCHKITKHTMLSLGPQYDVFYRSAGTGWHFHIEFDPNVGE